MSSMKGRLLWESSSSEDEDVRRNPRYFRERDDHMNKWNDEEFFVRFRFTKESVGFILHLVEPEIVPITRRNHAVTAIQQLLIVLRFFATGTMLTCVGDFGGIHKSTVSQIIKKVSNVIANLGEIYIQMPRREEIKDVQQSFYKIARFPEVIGTIDCTHIKIQSPGGDNAEYFRNRKGYFSLNVQIVGDANLKIRDIVARWPGSSHDQQIFSNSNINARFNNGEFTDNVLLGDSGYGLKQYVITPMLNPSTQGDHLFNEAQIRTRNPIERLFGVWKRRFPILSLGSRLLVPTTQSVIIACGVLHNISILRKEEVPPCEVEMPDDVEPINDTVELSSSNSHRQKFVNYFVDLL